MTHVRAEEASKAIEVLRTVGIPYVAALTPVDNRVLVRLPGSALGEVGHQMCLRLVDRW